jgi:5S rRNA maturation endonuclease (ribonuclease M5)/transcription elongation factor Elf1
MSLKVERLKEEFGLRFFGAKGWLSNKNIACPECGRKGKFGFKVDTHGGAVNCFFCDYSTNIYKYLKKVGKTELISFEQELTLKSTIRSLTDEDDEEEEKETEEVPLPRGFKNITEDEYLNGRNFLPEHYKRFDVGVTTHFLERKLKHHIIYSIFQDGKRLSWLARTRYSYKWHSHNLIQHKEEGVELVLRYMNSHGTEFDKILGNLDEITENTHTVIVVEGLFDACGLDTILKLNEHEEVKAVFTFGNKFSDAQIKLLRAKKSVKTVILMYDAETTKQSKSYGLKLSRYFETFVCHNEDPDKDPGNMDLKYCMKLLRNKKTALEYYLNTL